MNTDSNQDIDEMKAFAFDVLGGVGGFLGVGYAGYKMGMFTEVAGTFPSIAVLSGVLLVGHRLRLRLSGVG